jgi:hypothetical protein
MFPCKNMVTHTCILFDKSLSRSFPTSTLQPTMLRALKLANFHAYVSVPPRYEASGQEQFPLVLFLHGAGESGPGGLSKLKTHGVPRRAFREYLVGRSCNNLFVQGSSITALAKVQKKAAFVGCFLLINLPPVRLYSITCPKHQHLSISSECSCKLTCSIKTTLTGAAVEGNISNVLMQVDCCL